MSVTPTLAIALDVARYGGQKAALREPSADTLLDARVAMMSGDISALQLQWRDFSSESTGEDVQWDGGFSITAVLTISSTLGDATPTQATSVASFSESGTETHYYTGTLDLSGEAVTAALGANASVQAVLDIHVTVGSYRASYRVEVDLYRQADGGIITPGGGVEMVNSPNGQMRQRTDGVWEIYDVGLGSWVEPYLDNGVQKFVKTTPS